MPFDDIKILKLYYPPNQSTVVDLEFDSKEEFTKAASLQEGYKIKGAEFCVRFSQLIRRSEQTLRRSRKKRPW